MNSEFESLVFRPFKKVLIANRGEIALRIIRSCRDLNLSPLAVYSTADIHSRHVAYADMAVCIGEGPSQASYLNTQAILAAAQEMGAEAVHPGFGFLSENADFANAVLKAGLVWIGPSPAAIHAMGDKTLAKRMVTGAGVPCSPGKNEPLKDAAELKEIAKKIGYPLLLKAVAGGGGRGMRVVRKDEELEEAFQNCQREALSYFNNPDVFCERYIEKPRHVEIQILADSHGNVIHLFERDCTIQRRHQKLIEESPSAYLSEAMRQKMGEIAVKAAKCVNYVNAGTVEFIMSSPEEFYFMEMNTRIQVEHPVTEMVTQTDLVSWQIKIAMGEKLTLTQSDIKPRGWCFEARINAENPLSDFRPDAGTVKAVEFPAGPGVRVDSHIYSGYKIPEFYDSMIAKLIVFGSDRNDALQKLKRALLEFVIEGVETTIPYHLAVIDNAQFRENTYSTRFVEENPQILKNAIDKNSENNSLEEKIAQSILCLENLQTLTTSHQEIKKESVNKSSAWATLQRLESTARRSGGV